MILVIARHELKRLFYSPLAWTILGITQLVLALLFLSAVQNFIDSIAPKLVGVPNAPGVVSVVLSPLYLWAGVLMLAITPLLTMRSLSEEYQANTLSLLTSAPVSMTQIVLGKYLGLMGFMLVMIAMITLMPLSLTVGTHLDWGHLAAEVLGLLLLVGSFTAAGLYISSLTRQPTLAAVGSFGLLLLLTVLYISGTAQSTASRLFVYLSHFSHFLPFLRGEFDTAAAAYYVLFTLTFLVLTVRQLDGLRLPR
ncbi:ABC transporter permease [Acidihalobacter ferrooxydans]|uniref:ABC transporter permease n=1 Tax=Acidihalobacter ferrooxydans TaxID=1765967 RepID=A0A1P8UDX5_9GAMM|nr:ABC transporter permease subunit [Acidihalobacter ferrooxydans]APZ42067.1 ABC transporter permease [Acidihalobacter ferrooxydans]